MTTEALQTNGADAGDDQYDIVLEVAGLKKYFPVTKGIIVTKILGQLKAVDGISFGPPTR